MTQLRKPLRMPRKTPNRHVKGFFEMDYQETIASLIRNLSLDIDTEAQVGGRPPTMANSEFLTNKEQGDWAEQIVFNAINANSDQYCAVHYGRRDNIAAGDPGFSEFYKNYQYELNNIGKKPDLLIFHRADIEHVENTGLDKDVVQKAVAAIEVRSSSFLAERYSAFMANRVRKAEAECVRIRGILMREPFAALLSEKSSEIYRLVSQATVDTFKEIDFNRRYWSSSKELVQLSEYLKHLKEQMKILRKRDYLSITPKLEDIALVNRWIQQFGVKHYYLQVFFDKAYLISFEDVLNLVSDSKNEGAVFSIERDVKNQGKTTVKINVRVGRELLGRIDMPEHRSAMKELDRGRLLFYVSFHGGQGYLDAEVFAQEILSHE